jgi:hypothetical protein
MRRGCASNHDFERVGNGKCAVGSGSKSRAMLKRAERSQSQAEPNIRASDPWVKSTQRGHQLTRNRTERTQDRGIAAVNPPNEPNFGARGRHDRHDRYANTTRGKPNAPTEPNSAPNQLRIRSGVPESTSPGTTVFFQSLRPALRQKRASAPFGPNFLIGGRTTQAVSIDIRTRRVTTYAPAIFAPTRASWH